MKQYQLFAIMSSITTAPHISVGSALLLVVMYLIAMIIAMVYKI